MGVETAVEADRLPGSARPVVQGDDRLLTGIQPGQVRLCLMQGFSLSLGRNLFSIPLSAQRVAAFVALRNRPSLRPYVAEMLWLDATQDRAMGNLRSALWRLRQAGAEIVESTGDYLSLGRNVTVDVLDFVAWSRRLMTDADAATSATIDDITVAGELLPDWYDDWVLIERERLRQLRLHALERACVVLASMGEYGRAIEAGLAAITEEPLHESGHAAVIRAHLGEGNRAEAIRQYEAYVRLMREELGLGPSPAVTSLVHPLLTTSGSSSSSAQSQAGAGDTSVMVP
jgi:DNA-binding SARP family transcriptional activator